MTHFRIGDIVRYRAYPNGIRYVVTRVTTDTVFVVPLKQFDDVVGYRYRPFYLSACIQKNPEWLQYVYHHYGYARRIKHVLAIQALLAR